MATHYSAIEVVLFRVSIFAGSKGKLLGVPHCEAHKIHQSLNTGRKLTLERPEKMFSVLSREDCMGVSKGKP